MRRLLVGAVAALLLGCAAKLQPPVTPRVPLPPPPIDVVGLGTAGFSSVFGYLQTALNTADWSAVTRPDFLNITADLLWVQPSPDARFTRSLKVAFKAYHNGIAYTSAEFQTHQQEAAEHGKDMGKLVTERIMQHLRKQF